MKPKPKGTSVYAFLSMQTQHVSKISEFKTMEKYQ